VIPVVERDRIDGVPVLRADSPSGRHAAALVFRVGQFDETLPASGVTHMVEHLAFTDKPEAPYAFNANVTGRFTSFVMESADPSDIADFVESVCRGLTADQGRALDRERRILRTEAASRGGVGAMGTCLGERYGATGPGLANYQQFGLYRLGWADVDAWRSRWFVTGNAVLWIAGSWPAGLRLRLPYGTAPLPEPLRPLRLGLPGFVVAGSGGIGMSLTGPRSLPAHVTLDALQRRLTQVLRHEHGLSYEVKAAAEDLDRDLVHTMMAADALPEQTPMAAHSMLGAFESLTDSGCTEAEIADYARRLRDAYESPSGPAIVLQRRAQDILTGRTEREPEHTLLMVSELDAQATAAAAKTLYEGMIVIAPSVLPAVRGRMEPLPVWSERAVSGDEHKSVDSDAVLTTGEQGVMLTVEPGRQVTVRYDAVAALLRWNDGKRALVGTDGYAVQLDPDEWPDGPAVLEDIDRHVQPGVVVPIDAPGRVRPGRGTAGTAGTAAPEGGAAPSATPPRATHRSRGPARSWPARIVRALLVFVVIVGVLAIAGGDVSDGVAFVGLAVAGLAWQEFRRWRRRRGA
jgi:hypothetical protein